MSFMNAIEGMLAQGNTAGNTAEGAEQATPQQHGSITQALMEHFGAQPGGLGGLADRFRQNGMGGHVDSWLGAGENKPLEPQQVEQGMGQGAVESIAQKAGVSSGMVKAALAVGLPMLMAHLSQGSGQLPQEASSSSGLMGLVGKMF